MPKEEVNDRGSEAVEAYRMYASMSFVAVMIIVGVPLWWKTTEVYRVSLPYARIAELDKIPMKIAMPIQLAFKDQTRGALIKEELEAQFANSDVYDLRFELIILPENFKWSADNPSTVNEEEGSLRFIEWPSLQSEVKVTLSRTVLFSPSTSSSKIGRVLREWLLAENSLRATVAAMSTPAASRHDAAGRRRAPPAKAFDVTVSVVAPKPDLIKVDWAPREAIQQYLQPFVSELSAIHNFTLKSQWLYFVQLDFYPKQVPDSTPFKRHYMLAEDTIPHLITPLEKKLASHISKNPCLNLVLYTPACEDSPIHIYNKKGVRANGALDAFLSPRWGGVVIGNPPASVCEAYLNGDQTTIPIYQPPTREIMGYFLAQLRLLLGIQEQTPIPGAEVEPITTVSPRKWELDALIRIRTIEQVTSAKLTLRSLAQLLGEISNIVINDEVGASIYDAVENVEKTGVHLKNGDLMNALECSRNAFLSAEAAFTDPSLLALLYFPDDQKYAVYIPLFLPVMIPVLISAKNVWYWMKSMPSKEKAE